MFGEKFRQFKVNPRCIRPIITQGYIFLSVLKDEEHIFHGETFADGVRAVIDSDQIIAVGCNCCNPVSVAPLLRSAKTAIGTKPFVVYPDQRDDFCFDGR